MSAQKETGPSQPSEVKVASVTGAQIAGSKESRTSLQAELAARAVAAPAALVDEVGLFGTCGNSTWRNPVMERLRGVGINFFNPVVSNWTPECAEREAYHLAHGRDILFVITNETKAEGSLAETGWAELGSRTRGQNVRFVIQDYTEPDGTVNKKDPANRARALVRAHGKEAGAKIFDSVDAAVDDIIRRRAN